MPTHRVRVVTSLLALLLPAAGLASEPRLRPLPEPAMPQPFVLSYYANARTVELLTTLLSQPELRDDPVLREQVVTDLGRTMNPAAVPVIVRHQGHADWRVRAASARALGELPLYWVAGAFHAALVDADNRVAAQAARSAARQSHADAAGKIAELIARKDHRLTAEALDALTALHQPLPAEQTATLLADPRASVRLAALRHAAILPAEATPIDPVLGKLAAQGDPGIRARALALLARRAGKATLPALRAAGKHDDYRLRAAAVEGLGLVARDPAIIAALVDAKEPVRLAACRACGTTRDGAALEALWRVMTDDPVRDVQEAAREALTTLDHPRVPDRAGKTVVANLPALLALRTPRRMSSRQVAQLTQTTEAVDARRRAYDAAYILASVSPDRQALPMMLQALTNLSDCDGVLVTVCQAVGAVGDASAIEPLKDYLAFAFDTAQEYYRTRHNDEGPTVAFDEPAYAAALKALCRLDPDSAIPFINQTVELYILAERMGPANTAVMEIVRENWGALPAERVDHWLSLFIKDHAYGRALRWQAAHEAGKRKFAGARTAEALRHMLSIERSARQYIYVSAWAIQEITGQTPDLTEPKVLNPPNLAIQDTTDESR